MFAYLYTALGWGLWLVGLFLLPLLLLKKKYRQSFPARWLLVRNPPFSRSSIHFHACSLGETKGLAPLIEEVSNPNISVITQTGFNAAQEYKNAQVRYLPFEPLLWWWLRPQKALVVMEAELWYLLFFLSKKRGAKTLLVNARMSDRSFKRYRRFSWLYRKVFANIDKVFAQSPKDKERLEVLGAKNIEVVGNIKLLATPVVKKHYTKSRPLVVAASTHDPEEEIIATEWVMHLKDRTTLAVAPRHPERFEEVDELLSHIAKREGLSYHRLSQNGSLDGDIVLIDRIGVLGDIYAVADLVVLGGSFVEVGGHNPLEPAYFGVPIVSGPFIFNQQESYSYVDGIKVVEASELGQALSAPWQATKIVAKADIEPIIKELRDVV